MLQIFLTYLLRSISNQDVPNISVPFLAPFLAPNEPWTWNYTVAPQTALNHRTFPYPRGKVLGGSSSISEHPNRTLCKRSLIKCTNRLRDLQPWL